MALGYNATIFPSEEYEEYLHSFPEALLHFFFSLQTELPICGIIASYVLL